MSSRLREIASSALGRFGIPGIANVHILAPSAGGAGAQYWEPAAHGVSPLYHTSLTAALGLMTTGRNDTLLVTPDAHPQAAAIDWNKNSTHLVGMVPPGRMNMRSRLTPTAATVTLLTVSGYGNLIETLYIPAGYGATDITPVKITGERNSLINCHILPALATALDGATSIPLTISANEFFAKDCVIGGDTVAWTAGAALSLYGAADRSCRAIFENCTFIMNADAADPFFIKTFAGMGSGVAIFKGCHFINIGTSLTYAIDGAGLGNAKLFFDSGCTFAGVDDVVAAGYESSVWLGGSNTPINQVTGGASVALFNGLACHPDVS